MTTTLQEPDLSGEQFRRQLMRRALELPAPERLQFANCAFINDPALSAELESLLADAARVPSGFLTTHFHSRVLPPIETNGSPFENAAAEPQHALPNATAESDDIEVINVGALAFLGTMWSILWTAFRHPLTTSYIDVATGEVMERSDEDEV